jgi:hypothetical protein
MQVFADADIPVDVKKKRDRQGDCGQDKDKYRMDKPFGLFQIVKVL